MQRQQEQETRDKLVNEQKRIVTEAHWVIDQANVDLPKPYVCATCWSFSPGHGSVGYWTFFFFSKKGNVQDEGRFEQDLYLFI